MPVNTPVDTPMIPPAIRQQMLARPMAEAEPVTMQIAQRNPISQLVDPVSMVQKKLQELKLWAMDFLPLAERVHPPLTAFLAPLANIGNAMEQEVNKLRERTAPQVGPVAGAPSPVLSGAETVAPGAAGAPPAMA